MILNELKENPKNPRFITEKKFEQLVNSIKEFPQMLELRPVVYDENKIVLGGNMRLRALRKAVQEGLEFKDEYVKEVSQLSEEQKRRFVIADNAPFGEWDYDVLANEWDDLPLDSWGVDTSKWGEDKNPPRLDQKESKLCPKCGYEL